MPEAGKNEAAAAGSTPPARSRVNPEADARCIAAVIAGNREAFSELVERYQDAVISVVRGYTADAHVAEDIAQEVFLSAFVALPQLRDPRYFFPWLIQIARRHAAHAGRRGGKRSAAQPLTGAEPAPEANPATEESARVLRCVEELPEPYRQTVRLRYERQLSCKQIADVEGVAIGTVTSRLTRGLLILRNALESKKS